MGIDDIAVIQNGYSQKAREKLKKTILKSLSDFAPVEFYDSTPEGLEAALSKRNKVIVSETGDGGFFRAYNAVLNNESYMSNPKEQPPMLLDPRGSANYNARNMGVYWMTLEERPALVKDHLNDPEHKRNLKYYPLIEIIAKAEGKNISLSEWLTIPMNYEKVYATSFAFGAAGFMGAAAEDKYLHIRPKGGDSTGKKAWLILRTYALEGISYALGKHKDTVSIACDMLGCYSVLGSISACLGTGIQVFRTIPGRFGVMRNLFNNKYYPEYTITVQKGTHFFLDAEPGIIKDDCEIYFMHRGDLLKIIAPERKATFFTYVANRIKDYAAEKWTYIKEDGAALYSCIESRITDLYHRKKKL